VPILAIADDVYEEAVLDFVAIEETDENTFVNDGDDEQAYLLGLSQDYELLVIHLDDDGTPDKYAVMPTTGTGTKTAFGAAFAYETLDGGKRIYFAANDGSGLFQIFLPITIPESCWNSGLDTSSHAACGSGDTGTLIRVWDSEAASSNDGLNCPAPYDPSSYYPPTLSPSATPTTGPCPAGDVCWAEAGVAGWDCDTHTSGVGNTC